MLSNIFTLSLLFNFAIAQNGLTNPTGISNEKLTQFIQDRSETIKEAKFIRRPFGFRRPLVYRRPIVAPPNFNVGATAPNYNVGANAPNYNLGVQNTASFNAGRPQIQRPVIVRRPVMRPFGLRPLLARPYLRPRPIMIRPPTAALHSPANSKISLTLPQATSNKDRLPDIELRNNARFDEIKKPLMKIINSGAKIALHRVLQKSSEGGMLKKSGNKIALQDIVSGAELVLKHYLEMKNNTSSSRSLSQKSHDSTSLKSQSTNSLEHEDSGEKKQNNIDEAQASRRRLVDSTQTTPVSTTKRPTVDSRSTAVPNLLGPWQSSNLLKLIRHSPLYSALHASLQKPSSQINWKASNVSLIDAKIINSTKARRMTYIPSAWYSEDSVESSAKSNKLKLHNLGYSTAASTGTSRSDSDGEGSAEVVTLSSEEIPVSAESLSLKPTSRPNIESSEEASRHNLLVFKGQTKPLLYSASDETRSEEVPLWVLTTKKPTHSFGFGHSVVINNHRAPSQNGVKRRRTTTTKKPSTTVSTESTEQAELSSAAFKTTTNPPPTSNTFPLEVFDSNDYNTTIVHQNIITIAKPTRPFVVRPTKKFTPAERLTTTPLPDATANRHKPSVNWEDSYESNIAEQFVQESQYKPTKIKIDNTSPSTPPPQTAKKPSKKASSTAVAAVEATTIKPWTANVEAQFSNRPISQVPAVLNPFGSVIQAFPNSLFRLLQTLGGLVFALPTLLTLAFTAAMLLI